MKACRVAYEVSLAIPGMAITRSVVFVGKKAAKAFRAKHKGSKLRAVELCDATGKVTRRGKREF